MLGLATAARAAGESLLTRWDALETAHGVHLTAQLTLATAAPGAVLARLRAGPPARLAGDPVLAVTDLAAGNGALPPSDVLSYRLGGTGGGPAGDRPAGCAERTGRVVLRPSGTEPKLKAYLEVTEPVTAGELAGPRTAATARMAALRAAVEALMAAG